MIDGRRVTSISVDGFEERYSGPGDCLPRAKGSTAASVPFWPGRNAGHPPPSGVYGVPLGINRANVRSPAITWKIWFRLLVGRAAATQAGSAPLNGSSEKYVLDVDPGG